MLRSLFPILSWGRNYSSTNATNDLVAAVIVTVMLIPQSLAYALLAGLPAEVGLYASIAPLILYGIFGTSMTLSVGPVAVVSLLTATAIGEIAATGTPDYYAAAIVLACLSGLMLLAMGLLRMGFLASFLSHPVISGFITASAMIIAASQLKHIFGIDVSGHSLLEIAEHLFAALPQTHLLTAAIGAAVLIFLVWARHALASVLRRFGLSAKTSSTIARSSPVFAVIATIAAAWLWDLEARGVQLVGTVPAGLPQFALPSFDPGLWAGLLVSAALISVIGFVESISVAQTLAAKRRQRIAPDQELVGLGAANLGSAFTGGFAVTGGFSRSVVNFDAGADTPAAGIFTAVGIALATVFLTPVLYYLPKATLATTIIVAVASLIDFKSRKKTWKFSKRDFAAQVATIMATLAFGVEIGIIAGVTLSLFLHVYRTSRPHFAVVGLVPNTQHFRNVKRHDVVVSDDVLSLRVDESLYFANSRYLEDLLIEAIEERPKVCHVILMCSAVNDIDYSALEALEGINERLQTHSIQLHLSEVKGPVMDLLRTTSFLKELSGRVFQSQYDAIEELSPSTTGRIFATPPNGSVH